MAKAKHIQTEVLIIGGGLAGMSMAAVLGQAGVGVVCIDKADIKSQLKAKYDGRTTAISYASHKVLQQAGVWKSLVKEAEPILDIRVVDDNAPVFLHFSAEDDGNGEPFGWIVENQTLRKVLFQNITKSKHVTHIAPANITKFVSGDAYAGVVLEDGTKVTAPLMIGADGRASAVRSWLGIDVKRHDYQQTAIVCNAVHEKSHEQVAVEHFRPSGPFAVLPMTDDEKGRHRSSIVWSEHGGDANNIVTLSDKDFDARLQALFGPHLGKVQHVTTPMAYPLSLQLAEHYVGHRTALMAEAAHAIHPIAGQGLNLSMRDVDYLAGKIVEHLGLGLDIGSATLLEDYERLRKRDTRLMAQFTDVLTKLFSNNRLPVKIVRNIGLGAVQKTPLLKRYFAKQAMGLLSGRIV